MAKKKIDYNLAKLVASNAAMQETFSSPKSEQSTQTELKLSLIEPNPWQPRFDFDESYIQELAQSIEIHGLLQPIIVIKKEDEDGYYLVAGENRYRAFKLLNRYTIPVIISQDKVSHEKLATNALVENIHRKNLHPIEIGIAIQQLLEKGVFDNQQQFSEFSGIGKSTVSKFIAANRLFGEVQQLVLSKNYKDVEVLNRLSKVEESALQLQLINTILDKNLDRESALRLIHNYENKISKEVSPLKVSKKRVVIELSRLDETKRALIDEHLQAIYALILK